MTPATVFDWNHGTKGILWRSNCVKHHVEPRADFWVNTLLHIVKIPTFYLRRYGQNCPYCRKIEEIYKKKIHVAR
jgi:hypothetical protein